MANNQKISEKGTAFIRSHEGFIGKAYRDPVGILTLGAGFTWRSNAFRIWWSRNRSGPFNASAKISREEADDALKFIIDNEYGKAVNDFLGQIVPQNVYDGMCSTVFNCGPGSLEWSWAALIKDGKIDEGANRLKTTATTASGRTLPGLVRRRKEEALLISKGIYTGINGNLSESNASDDILERYDTGKEVAKLIIDLHNLGYYDGVMDDVFGVGTERAVMSFQRAHNLDVDGKAGPITLAAIKKALAKPTPTNRDVKEAEGNWLVRLALSLVKIIRRK